MSSDTCLFSTKEAPKIFKTRDLSMHKTYHITDPLTFFLHFKLPTNSVSPQMLMISMKFMVCADVLRRDTKSGANTDFPVYDVQSTAIDTSSISKWMPPSLIKFDTGFQLCRCGRHSNNSSTFSWITSGANFVACTNTHWISLQQWHTESLKINQNHSLKLPSIKMSSVTCTPTQGLYINKESTETFWGHMSFLTTPMTSFSVVSSEHT